MPRGHRGCWTCRIRHRRCDESVPNCNECSTRHITRHGYGLDAPEWMSDDRLLQEELRRIKGAVKETSDASKPPRTNNSLDRQPKKLKVREHKLMLS
ncbi:hypothetical protein BKA56DRAFT_606476 [Ilyonectria sp. MPI-CAGE-AT-0026]|nr:hypothetical protein BKA56DRAFT_606476 [Ilyonectria sp. MPI-CAGE-AT-0026]